MSQRRDPAGGSPDKRSYQDDPRYREYYERMRRENEQRRGQQKANYDDILEPMSLDEVAKSGYQGVVLPDDSSGPKPESRPAPVRPASTPAPMRPVSGPAPMRPASAPAPMPPSSGRGSVGSPAVPDRVNELLVPGAILRFDDGSIAVYKDAVSGKDYALFYFLEHGGHMEPRGIFLEQYEYQRIGLLPLGIFEELKQNNAWDRDAIVFHLDRFEFTRLIPRAHAGGSSAPAPAAESSSRRNLDSTGPLVAHENRPKSSTPERGQAVTINVGGRAWEAVFWTRDEIGDILAHNTNGKWALMHLDLKRFRDSLELGSVLSPEELDRIQRQITDGCE